MAPPSSSLRHPQEKAWLAYASKQTISLAILLDMQWLEQNYPGSVQACRPAMRVAYTDAVKKEEAARLRFTRSI
jgi:hypothetical protein